MTKQLVGLTSMVALLVLLVAPQSVFAIDADEVKAVLNSINEELAATEQDFRIEKVEFLTYDEAGIVVFANNRTHQLNSHWVPFDPRRHGGREIYWLVDQVDQTSDVPWADVVAATGSAMNTWNSLPGASIPLVDLPDYGLDWGIIQYLLGFGGMPAWYADITHAGWLPEEFFDLFGGGTGIIGATFTFVWVDTGTGEPSDIDNNGKEDVAFREIYYNDYFNWQIDAYNPDPYADPPIIDTETIVLHEVGHGLSLGHFGKIFLTLENFKFHVAPEAVMNAFYLGLRQELLGTDIASFKSLYAPWPNK